MSIASSKVIFFGSTSVGKTTLINRWCDNEFDPYKLPTLGVGTRNTLVEIDGVEHNFQIWDTAGQDEYSNTTQIYFKNANGGMLVFDISRKESFNDLSKWIEKFVSVEPKSPIVIVGNKCDLENREVSYDDAQKFAANLGYKYFETSAKNGFGVEEAFSTLFTEAVSSETPNETEKCSVDIASPEKNTQKQGCKC